MKRFYSGLLLLGTLIATPIAVAANPQVRLTTTVGSIELELDADKAPATVRNFLSYVDAGFYNGTVFHRVIPGFMIQGGGFEPGMKQKPTRASVRNEAKNGLKNRTGSVAMARTLDPDSATSQFFINTVDNQRLDHRDTTIEGAGYCVFGRVVRGMDVVQRIEKSPTRTVGPFANVPENDIVILKAERIRAR